ncbi:hypothetical protein OBK24_09475 [Empedobacter falsenii]
MDTIILGHSLYIDKEYESFINKFSSTTGSDFPKGKMGNYLTSWYEGYLYCLMIGLNTNSRHYEGYVKKHQKMDRWSTQNINQYKYCIARVIGREDIVNELGLNSRESIEDNYIDQTNLLKKIKDICDQFALGGLHYLRKEYDNDSSLFDDPFALSRIYENSLI